MTSDFWSSRLWFVPRMRWFAGGEIVENQVDVREQLRQQNDLAGVHGDVLGDVEDGSQGCRGCALDRIIDLQLGGIKVRERLINFNDCRSERVKQLSPWKQLPFIKLGLPFTLVRQTT